MQWHAASVPISKHTSYTPVGWTIYTEYLVPGAPGNWYHVRSSCHCKPKDEPTLWLFFPHPLLPQTTRNDQQIKGGFVLPEPSYFTLASCENSRYSTSFLPKSNFLASSYGRVWSQTIYPGYELLRRRNVTGGPTISVLHKISSAQLNLRYDY